jgi:predicted nucleic acid-binding protein
MVLIDTSAEARIHLLPDQDQADVRSLAERYLQATCTLLDLEVGFAARSPAVYQQIVASRSALLIALPLDEAVCARAAEVQGLLVRRGLQRAVGATDLLIAACAEVHGALLLHYDFDFEIVAAVTGQPTQWLAARGALP